MDASSRIAKTSKKQGGRPRVVEAWLRGVVEIETDACVEFPFKRNSLGYGLFCRTVGRKGRKYRRAHNFVCELAHGPAPEGAVAIHSCDNPPCVNKRHLRWGSMQDNSDDASKRGRHSMGARHPGSKLTENDVSHIRRRVAQGTQQKDLAIVYGVTRSVICEVVNRKAWKHVA